MTLSHSVLLTLPEPYLRTVYGPSIARLTTTAHGYRLTMNHVISGIRTVSTLLHNIVVIHFYSLCSKS